MGPPPRRISDVARRPGCPLSWMQLEELAWADGWKDRALCWDRHLDGLRLAAVEQVVQEDARMRATRQGRVGKKLQTLAELELDKLLALSKRTDVRTEVSVIDVTRAARIGVWIERLALGDSTDRVETGPDLSKFSADDLRQLRELQEKAT